MPRLRVVDPAEEAARDLLAGCARAGRSDPIGDRVAELNAPIFGMSIDEYRQMLARGREFWRTRLAKLGKQQRKARKPTLSSALKQAAKAGTPVRRASQAPDGTVTLVIGEPGTADQFNGDTPDKIIANL